MNKLKAIWKIEELRGKILVTLLLLLAFRLGCCLPVPFVSNTALDAMFSNNSIFGYMNMLSGGALSRSAFFALGVSPYINASIITQLLCVALPSWEALQKETTGKDKLDEYTKRIALAMAVVMSVGYYFVLRNYGALKYTAGKSGIFAAIVIIATFLAGSQISVWLGGRIDEYGIGNGVSLLIFAGIVSRWSDINSIITNVIGKVKAGEWLYSLIGILTAVAMLAAVWFVTYSDGAERRVPVQYAARTQRVRPAASYIPIKLLMSGVMPIIFAGVIMSLPATLDMFIDATKHQRLHAVLSVFTTESWLYCLLYVLLIAAFNFFYIEIQFDVIRNPGCQRIAKCCSISGLRHTCHQICLYRGILCQKLSGLDPACIYTHPVNMTVRSCKIDVLKNTACFLFFLKCHGHIGLNTFFRRNGHNFSRQHITHKCRTNGVKCTGFRCDNIRIVTLSDTKRLKAVWVTRPDQFTRTCHNQCVSSLKTLARTAHSFFC